ncbi:hypothetical protein P7C70_g3983, partial [Phenoliferia sp. Uapishka_3]
MFPKAKRFTDKSSSFPSPSAPFTQLTSSAPLPVPSADIPGPGAYDVPMNDPLAPWKKGAMMEKAERFKEGEEGPDTFGLYDPKVGDGVKENKRPKSSLAVQNGGPEKLRLQMEDLKQRLQTTHEKELARLQAKLVRAEQSATTHKAELAQLKSDLRTAQHSTTSLTTQLSKSDASLKKHQALLPTLQSKLEELSTSHAASHARKDASIAELTSSKTKLEAELEQSRSESAKLREELAAVNSELEESQRVNDKLDSENWNLENSLQVARSQLLQSATHHSNISQQHKSELESANTTSYTQSLRILHLERLLADKSEVIEVLGCFSLYREEELEEAQLALESTFAELEFVNQEWAWERASRDGGEKEWRQRTRSEKRELDWVREEVGFEQELRKVEKEMMEDLKRELEEEKKAREWEVANLRSELEIAEGELDLALSEEIPRLESELETMRGEYEEAAGELAEKADEVEEQREALEKLEEEGERLRGELEEAKRAVGEERKVSEKERGEKKAFVRLLGQTRAAESGLREELDAMTNAYEEIADVKAQYTQLQRTIDELARRNALAEADVKQLGDLNTDLLSHGNAHQRIRHVAQIRAELDQSRKNHLATTSALATTQREMAALKSELDAYRTVSTIPAISSRSKVVRTFSMGDDGEDEDVYLGVSSAPQSTGGMRISIGLGTLDERTEPFEEDEEQYEVEEEAFQLPPSPPAEDEPEVSYCAPLPPAPLRFGVGGGRASVGGGSQGIGGRKAGRVRVGDGKGKGKARESGGVRMEGRMSIRELIG